jgi:formate--tetrahydrofolate ligase
VALSEVWAKGGKGGVELAEEVIRLAENAKPVSFTYPDEASVKDKLTAIAQRIYGADGVIFTDSASSQIKKIETMGFGRLPVCVAKTQYSFSDDPAKLGWPKGFSITVKSVKISAGAGCIVALTGDIMTMPGLPKVPSAESIDVDEHGRISGLF